MGEQWKHIRVYEKCTIQTHVLILQTKGEQRYKMFEVMETVNDQTKENQKSFMGIAFEDNK